MATTTRWGLPYPQLDGLVAADVPQWMHDLAFALDDVAKDDQGTLANRPVSTSGSPGKAGRYYMVKGDGTPANNGILWRDNGTGWDQVGSGTIFDTTANRPLATAVPKSTRFFSTDQIAEWVTDGTNWIRLGTQPGEIAMTLGAAATSGKILLQGQTWPATTGIYAELHALLGGTTLPDMRQRVPVGWKSADSDFGTLLATGGEKTHTLTVPEMPTHTHPPGAGTAFHDPNYGSGPFNDVGAGPGNVTSTADAATTGATGGGGAHNNLQPFIVVNFEAKL